MILTYRYRLKTTSGAVRTLEAMARAVNVVWNFCAETQEAARRWNKRWPSGFDLINLTHGTSRPPRSALAALQSAAPKVTQACE